MGLVKYFKPPFRSKGKDFCTVFCLIDDAQSASYLPCNLFNPYKEKLPIISCCGELLMVKGLAIKTFQNALQGVGHESSLVGLFPVDLTSPPSMIGDWYNMKGSEIGKLQQLRQWATTVDLPLLLNSRLEELTEANYCSTVCVVVAVHRAHSGNSGVVLTVTDGTVPRHPLATDICHLEVVSNDPVLQYLYHGLTSTVVVSTVSQPQVAAGEVVQLVNICMVKKSERMVYSSFPTGCAKDQEKELVMDLMVQDHKYYQGALKVLPKDSSVTSSFKKSLPMPEGPHPSWRPECSLSKLSTKVLCDFSGVATLKDIQSTAAYVGSVHVIDVQVVGVGRSVCSKVEDMSQLRCPKCMTLYLTPQPQNDDYHQLFDAGDFCVCCCHLQEGEVTEKVDLRYMFAFSLLVADHTAKQELMVSGSEGNTFLHQPPTNMYSDVVARNSMLGLIYQMTGGNDPFHHVPLDNLFSLLRPTLRLGVTVINSYTGQRRYKITDTTLLYGCE